MRRSNRGLERRQHGSTRDREALEVSLHFASDGAGQAPLDRCTNPGQRATQSSLSGRARRRNEGARRRRDGAPSGSGRRMDLRSRGKIFIAECGPLRAPVLNFAQPTALRRLHQFKQNRYRKERHHTCPAGRHSRGRGRRSWTRDSPRSVSSKSIRGHPKGDILDANATGIGEDFADATPLAAARRFHRSRLEGANLVHGNAPRGTRRRAAPRGRNHARSARDKSPNR